MNGTQLHRALLARPHRSARELVADGAKDTPWHLNRQCERHPYIFISGWVEEYNQMKGWEWAPRWSAIEAPKDAPHP